MIECSQERMLKGLAYPRTCMMCGFGPCQRGLSPQRPYDMNDMALKLANKIFPHYFDQTVRDELATLLREFAAEIRRSAIEP